MKLIIEGTEEEIKQCLEKLAGEKVTIERPTYWVYPPTPDPCSPVFVYPTWVHPNDWSQFGVSRYGTTYERDGLAWYCPHCA
jgi:hypothetical protein